MINHRRSTLLVIVFLATFLCGCACHHSSNKRFAFDHDTFAYPNELRWTYQIDSNGKKTTARTEPPPEYSLHCFPMVRAAREFFYHARFDPNLRRTNFPAYERLVRAIVQRSSRCPSPEIDKIVIPGYADLHEFSAAHPAMLKKECGGAWRSFFQRGNWRMVFPVTRHSQAATANNLSAKLESGRLPIVHVYRFPDTSLNHSLLLYAREKDETGKMVFYAYDPNNPLHPARLVFDGVSRTFLFERNQYFGGGSVKVYEVYHGLLY